MCFFFIERLLNAIQQTKQIIAAKISESSAETQEELTKHIEKVAKTTTSKYSLIKKYGGV